MVSSQIAMPQRIFLDSSVLQTLLRYGGYLYDGESIPEEDPIHRDKQGPEKLEALRWIMAISERAPFEFALSENSFVEVRGSGSAKYLRWTYDVLDHWLICVEESGIPETNQNMLAKLDTSAIGYLGVGDRALLKDALTFGCDTFLTMENKLPKNKKHLLEQLGIHVESPCEVWARIEPWAALFR